MKALLLIAILASAVAAFSNTLLFSVTGRWPWLFGAFVWTLAVMVNFGHLIFLRLMKERRPL